MNGLRACAKKGFGDWLEDCGAEVVGLQETRARPEQLPGTLADPPGWSAHFVAAERDGYSGVGLYARRAPDRLETRLGPRRFDAEGRVGTREDDLNADGSPDVRVRYKNGRIVSREIEDPAVVESLLDP